MAHFDIDAPSHRTYYMARPPSLNSFFSLSRLATQLQVYKHNGKLEKTIDIYIPSSFGTQLLRNVRRFVKQSRHTPKFYLSGSTLFSQDSVVMDELSSSRDIRGAIIRDTSNSRDTNHDFERVWISGVFYKILRNGPRSCDILFDNKAIARWYGVPDSEACSARQ